MTVREYKIVGTLDVSQIKEGLDGVERSVDALAGKLDKAFKAAGQSAGRDAAAQQKRTADAAKKTADAAANLEKQYIRLLAAELKLQAGTDKAIKAFISQRQAAYQSADAFLAVIRAGSGLTDNQVRFAVAVAEAKQRINELNASLRQEGTDAEAAKAEILQLEAALKKIQASAETPTMVNLQAQIATGIQSPDLVPTEGIARPDFSNPANIQAQEAAVRGLADAYGNLGDAQTQLNSDAYLNTIQDSNLALEQADKLARQVADTVAHDYLPQWENTARIPEEIDDQATALYNVARAADEAAGAGEQIAEVADEQTKASDAAKALAVAEQDAARQRQALVRQQLQDEKNALAQRKQVEAERKQGVAEELAQERERQAALRQAQAQERLNLAQQRLAQQQRQQAAREAQAQQRAQQAADRLAAQSAARLAAQQRAASRELVRLARTYPEIRQKLASLAHEENGFNIVLGQTSTALGSVQSRFNAVAASIPQFEAGLERIRQKYGDLNLQFERGAFGAPGAAGRGALSAAGIGIAVAGFEQLRQVIAGTARQAKEFFEQLVQESARTALEFESVQTSFKAIFGDDTAALAVLGRVREESRRLGVDLNLIVRRFLPQVGSLDKALKIGELVAGLARLEPEQGEAGAAIAINELLTGDPQSLRKRFELPTDEILRLQQELGNVDGGLQGLEKLLKQRGVDFESMAGSAGTAFGRIREYIADLRNSLGQPIIQELTDQFNETMRILDENREDIDRIVSAIGRLIAQVIKFIGTKFNDFLENLDTESALSILDSLSKLSALTFDNLEPLANLDLEAISSDLGEFGRILSSLKLIVDIIKGVRDAVVELAGPLGSILKSIPGIGIFFTDLSSGAESAEGKVNKLSDTLIALAEKLALAGAGVIGLATTVKTYVSLLDDAFAGTIDSVDLVEQSLEAGREAARAFFDDIEAQYQQMNLSGIATPEGGGLSPEAEAAALAYADAVALLNHNLEEQAILEEEVKEAQESLAESSAELTEEISRRRLEIEREMVARGIEIEKEAAERRAKIWRDYADEVAEAILKLGYDLQDAATDLDRKEEDAAIKAGRDQLRVEEDLAKERIKLEEDLARELAKIQREFERDARKAIKANDAIAFLDAKERAEFESNEARIDHANEVEDAEAAAEEKRQAINDKLAEEIADAELAHQRKLEDLSRALGRQLAAEAEARDQNLRELDISTAAEQEKLKENYAQQLAEFAVFTRDKLKAYADETKEERDLIAENLRLILEMEGQNFRARLAMMGIFLEDRQNLLEESNDQLGGMGQSSGGGASGSWADEDEDGGLDGRVGGGPGPRPDPEQEARIARYNQFGFENMLTLVLATLRSVGLNRQADSVETIRSMETLIATIEAFYRTHAAFRESMQVQGFEHGGITMGNRPIIVGDSSTGRPNPELVYPNGPTSIIPLSRLMTPPETVGPGGMSNYNYSRSLNVQVAMFHPAHLPPALLQMHQQVARAHIENLLRGY